MLLNDQAGSCTCGLCSRGCLTTEEPWQHVSTLILPFFAWIPRN